MTEYDRTYYLRNKDRYNAHARAYSFRLHRPKTIDEWVRFLRRRMSLNTVKRSGNCAEIPTFEETKRLLTKAIKAGIVSLKNPISAPSPDRRDNSKGYVVGNVRVIPRWLNLARNTWNAAAVDRAIRQYANRHSS